MAFNPARAISLLRDGGHSETQAQTVVETILDSHEDLSTKADLREQTAELKIWTLKLVLAQTALMVTIAVGAVVVAGVLWG